MEIKFSDSRTFTWNNVKFSEACEWTTTTHPRIHGPPNIRVVWKGVTCIFLLKSNSQLINAVVMWNFMFSIRCMISCRVHGANDQSHSPRLPPVYINNCLRTYYHIYIYIIWSIAGKGWLASRSGHHVIFLYLLFS